MKKIKILFTKNQLVNLLPFLVFLLFVFFFTRKFVFQQGALSYGEFLGSFNYFLLLQDFFHSWGERMAFGHTNIGLTTVYGMNPVFWILPPGYFIPLLTVLSLLETVFHSETMKVYILLGLFLPFTGMYFLAKYWFKNEIKKYAYLQIIAFLSAFIYTVNFIMGDRIAAAHLRYNLAHGLFPLLILSTFLTIDAKKINFRYILSSGLIIAILVWLMPHLITIYIIFFCLYFAIVLRKKIYFIVLLQHGFLAISIGVLLNIHIWLPSLMYKEELAYLEDPHFLLSYVIYISKALKYVYSFLLASGLEESTLQPNIYSKILYLKSILVFLAILGALIQKDRRKSIFLILIAFIGILFSLGTKYPFERIYSFLYEYVFLFKPFRDVGKFLILYVFSISLLIPFIVIEVKKILGKKMFILSTVFVIIFVMTVNPNFTSGNFSNTIIPFQLPNKYFELQKFFENSSDDYRIAIYPNDKTIGDYDWFPDNARSLPAYHTAFQSLLPLRISVVNSGRVMYDFTSRYLDIIESNIESDWAIERLADAKVRYLIVDPSIPGYEKSLEIFDKHPLLTKTHKITGFTFYEIKNYVKDDVLFRPSTYYFGNISGLKVLPPNLALINLGFDNNSFQVLKKKYSNTLILNQASTDYLFLSLLTQYRISFLPEARFAYDGSKDFFIPAEYLRFLTQQGISFYNPELIQTGGISSIEKKFNINPGNYYIFLSTINIEEHSNNISVKINRTEKNIRKFRTTKDTLQWVNLGKVIIENKLNTISIFNNENKSLYIDSILVVPEKEFYVQKRVFDELINKMNVIIINDLSDNVQINTNKLNQIAVLSRSYSKFWNICNSEVFRTNFYATGSSCNKNNLIQPSYQPESIYTLSLIASGSLYLLTLAGIIWPLSIIYRRKK